MKTMSMHGIIRNLALTLFLIALPTLAVAAISDEDLHDQIRHTMIHNMGVNIFQLGIDVNQGNVVLSGGVDVPEQIERATKLVQVMPGVVSVVNNMQVKGDMPEYQQWRNDYPDMAEDAYDGTTLFIDLFN